MALVLPLIGKGVVSLLVEEIEGLSRGSRGGYYTKLFERGKGS